MKRPTFNEGAMTALAISLAASLSYHGLAIILPGGLVLHILIAGVALAYLLYLLVRSPGRVGRISAVTVWVLATAGALSLEASLLEHLLLQMGFIWLIRSLYFYSSVLAALADLGLSAFSLSAALWAAERSGSIFLSIWCLLLVQALFVTIPPNLRRKAPQTQTLPDAEDRFERAHRAADNALRRISTVR